MEPLRSLVEKEIGPFSNQEYIEAMMPVFMKIRNESLARWYVAFLIAEKIKQHRLTLYCLLDFQRKKAATVGERV